MTLDEYMRANELDDPEIADMMGVDRSTVFRYRNGTRFPSFDAMVRLYQATRGEVSPNDWIPHDERVRARRAHVA